MAGERKLCRVCRHKVVNEDIIRVVGQLGYVCKTCAPLYIFKCESCENHFSLTAQKEAPDGRKLCQRCFDHEYIVCGGCNQVTSRSNNRYYNSRYYCQPCFEQRFQMCASCETAVRREDVRLHNGQPHCRHCYQQANRAIHEYSFTPIPLSFNKMAWENTTFLGIELEVECNNDNGEWNDQAIMFRDFLSAHDCADKFYFKEDGSIEGYEIVSHPFTLQYAHKHLNFKKMLEYLRKNDYTSYDNGHCGLHVHVGRNCFSTLEIYKLRAFFAHNARQIDKFSAREGKNMSYCQFEHLDKRQVLSTYQQGRYWALNLNTRDHSTVEFRVFRGTLKYDRFMASLKFVYALIDFVKCTGLARLMKGNSWGLFREYVEGNGEYKFLSDYLKKEGI